MNTPKNLVIVLLAATTIGGAVLAWRQYSDLVELRAASLKRDERADLQKRIWDLEKLNRDLQDKIAANREPGAPSERVAGGPDGEERRGPEGGRGGRGDPRGRGDSIMQQANAVRDLMNKPEVQALMNLQQKAGVEARYAALFKNLNLPPDQIEKLKTLLAERSNTAQDVFAAAREQGIDPRENPAAFRKMNADAQNVINNAIKATIGDAGFAQLATYEQTLPQRNLVNDLQQRLSYTNSPLSSAQADQLVGILAANAPQRTANATPGQPQPGQPQPGMLPGGPRGPGPGGPGGGPGFDVRGGDLGGMIAGVLGPGPAGMVAGLDLGRGSGAATVTSAAVTQAQGILAPTQLAALQQIQQQQQAQQQLRQIVSETLGANQPQNPKGGPAPGGTPPGRRPGGG
ncbi:MAG: hypothetical protein V4773_13395 [Verrucomicrobiota bacterium]